jgi:hypothetical protein
MAISEIKLAYKNLKEQVFSHFVAQTGDKPLFDETRLEGWAKALVKEYTGDENSPMIPERNSPYGKFGNIHRKGCDV